LGLSTDQNSCDFLTHLHKYAPLTNSWWFNSKVQQAAHTLRNKGAVEGDAFREERLVGALSGRAVSDEREYMHIALVP
jgi:hypothetical protein